MSTEKMVMLLTLPPSLSSTKECDDELEGTLLSWPAQSFSGLSSLIR